MEVGERGRRGRWPCRRCLSGLAGPDHAAAGHGPHLAQRGAGWGRTSAGEHERVRAGGLEPVAPGAGWPEGRDCGAGEVMVTTSRTGQSTRQTISGQRRAHRSSAQFRRSRRRHYRPGSHIHVSATPRASFHKTLSRNALIPRAGPVCGSRCRASSGHQVMINGNAFIHRNRATAVGERLGVPGCPADCGGERDCPAGAASARTGRRLRYAAGQQVGHGGAERQPGL